MDQRRRNRGRLLQQRDAEHHQRRLGNRDHRRRARFDDCGHSHRSCAGSTWNEGLLSLSSNGKLNITTGGSVSVVGQTYIASYLGSSGTINLGSGGTLTTGSLRASPSQVTGTGTINAYALVSDMALQFSSTASLKQTIPWNGVTLNLDMSMPGRNGVLVRGLAGNRLLDDPKRGNRHIQWRLSRLLQRRCGHGDCLRGAHSTWSNGGGDLTVGYQGSAMLKITNGGAVTNAEGVIGVNVGSRGVMHGGRRGLDVEQQQLPLRRRFRRRDVDDHQRRHGHQQRRRHRGDNSSFGSANWGTVTVYGAGSKWINSSWDIIFGSDDGFAGKGTLNITMAAPSRSLAKPNLALPRVPSPRSILAESGGTGGTLTTGSLCASPSQLTGAGTVQRPRAGERRRFAVSACSERDTVSLERTPPPPPPPPPHQFHARQQRRTGGAGLEGKSGSLTIQNGTAVTSNCGYLGYASVSQGTACVDVPARSGPMAPMAPSTSGITATERCGSQTAARSPIGTPTSATIRVVGAPSPSTCRLDVDQ